MAPLAKRTSKVNAPRVLADLTKEAKSTTVELSPITAAVSKSDVSQAALVMSEHSDMFKGELVRIMAAPSVIKRGPVVLLDIWYQIGQDMSIFPRVGSKYDKNVNRPHDLRTVRIKKADGTTDTKWSSWYGDTAMVNGTGWIDQFLNTLNDDDNPLWHMKQCELAANTPATGIYAHLSGNGEELNAMKAKWKTRRSGALAAIKRAVRVHHQLELINAMPNVCAEFATTKHRDPVTKEVVVALSTTDSPIKLYDREDRGTNKQYAVSGFLALKPYGSMMSLPTEKGVPGDYVPDPDACSKDATWEELKNTSAKGADEDGDDVNENPDGDDGLIKTIPGVFGEITRLENFIDNENQLVLLHKALSAKGADADHRVTQLIEFAATINNLAAPYRARFAEIKASVQPKSKTA